MFVDGVWVFLFGLMYFRGIETSQRNFSYYKDLRKRGASEGDAIDALLLLKTIPEWHPRIVLQSTILGLPGLLAPLPLANSTYHLIVAFSFGTFVNGVAPPTEAEPEPADARRPFRLVVVWGLGKLDQVVKALVFALVISVITWIPGLGKLLQAYGETVFAVVPGKQVSAYFEDLAFGGLVYQGLVRAVPLLLCLGVLARLFTLVRFNWVMGAFLLSIAPIFVGYQAMLHSASGAGRTFPSVPQSLEGGLAMDLAICVVGLLLPPMNRYPVIERRHVRGIGPT